MVSVPEVQLMVSSCQWWPVFPRICLQGQEGSHDIGNNITGRFDGGFPSRGLIVMNDYLLSFGNCGFRTESFSAMLLSLPGYMM